MSLLPHPPQLLADVQSVVMLRSFAIAVVVVAPFGALLVRRVRRRQAATAVAEPDTSVQPTEEATPTLESVIDEISSLGEAVRSGRAGAGPVTISVPRRLTMSGDEAPPAIVDAIVRDALLRSGLVPTAELDAGDVRVIECTPRATTRD